MKKLVLVFGIVTALGVALLTSGYVFAQGNTPPTPQGPGTGYGQGGMMGARGMHAGVGDGVLHDTLVNVFAEELGLTVDELNTRLKAGETMAEIAVSEDLTLNEFFTLMTDARVQAIDQAVADGTLTSEQAEWMQQRSSRMNGSGARGQGMRGMRAGTMNCPYNFQTNP